ncbi:MAG: response regulator [Burkholderiaceae bacterium]
MIRVVTVDDHELIREGVKKIVRSCEDIQVVGEASTFGEAKKVIQCSRPDIVILDINLPDMEGLLGLAELCREFPKVSFLILSMHGEDLHAVNALKLGASGYITKSMAAEELLQAILTVRSGKTYISSHVAELLARSVREKEHIERGTRLTVRERDVASRIGAGLRPKQIAAELNISISSVNTYRSRIFQKLGIKSNAALIRHVITKGL